MFVLTEKTGRKIPLVPGKARYVTAETVKAALFTLGKSWAPSLVSAVESQPGGGGVGLRFKCGQ